MTVGFLAGWGFGRAALDGTPLYQDEEMHCMVTQGLRDRKTLRVNYPVATGAETVWFAGMAITDGPKIADAIKVPVTFQIFGNMPIADARANRVTCCVYASILQNVAHDAVYDALTELKATGMMAKAVGATRLGGHIPPEFRAKVTRTADIAARGKKYNVAE